MCTASRGNFLLYSSHISISLLYITLSLDFFPIPLPFISSLFLVPILARIRSTYFFTKWNFDMIIWGESMYCREMGTYIHAYINTVYCKYREIIIVLEILPSWGLNTDYTQLSIHFIMWSMGGDNFLFTFFFLPCKMYDICMYAQILEYEKEKYETYEALIILKWKLSLTWCIASHTHRPITLYSIYCSL